MLHIYYSRNCIGDGIKLREYGRNFIVSALILSICILENNAFHVRYPLILINRENTFITYFFLIYLYTKGIYLANNVIIKKFLRTFPFHVIS